MTVKIGGRQSEMIQQEHCSLHPPSHVIHCRVALIWNKLWRVDHHCSRSAGSNFLPSLCSHLNNFLMRIRVQGRNKGWTGCRPVLGEKPARLVSNTAGIAKGFWTHWSCSPLWGLGYLTMHAFPNCLLWLWVLIHLHSTWRNNKLNFLLLLVFWVNMLWYLDHKSWLGKALRIWRDSRRNKLLGHLSDRRCWRNELHCRARSERSRARTLAASTPTFSRSNNFRAARCIFLSWAVATALKDRNWAGSLELVVWRRVLFVDRRRLLFLHCQASPREGILHKVR